MFLSLFCRNDPPYVYDPSTRSFTCNPGFLPFPEGTPPAYVELASRCISNDAKARPTFTEVGLRLQEVSG